MTKTLINPPTLYDGTPAGLSHGVVAAAQKLLFCSGQVAWDAQHRVTADTVAGQLEHALANLKTVLAAGGASPADLLQVRIYIRGEVGAHTAALMPILFAFFGASRVSLTVVGVASLASPETLVEVEAVAGVPAPAST